MDELRLLVLDQFPEFGNRLRILLKSLDLEYQWVTELETGKGEEEPLFFDLFFWLIPAGNSHLSTVQELITRRGFLLTCAFVEKEENLADFDATFVVSDYDEVPRLRRLLENIVNLARRLKTQKELSSLLLHDIRTPLQNLASYAGLLSEAIFGPLNEGQEKIVRTIELQNDLATELLQELTDIVRFKRKALQLSKKTVDFARLLNEVLRSLWIWADRRNIKIQTYCSKSLPGIKLDPLAIKRVLFNLIFNALKFTGENGVVRIVVNEQTAQSNKHELLFQVTDSGPGIPEEHVDALFKKYYRLTHRSELLKGTGLGLYIAKWLVEAHGGRIGAYNNREGGATFYFTLPY